MLYEQADGIKNNELQCMYCYTLCKQKNTSAIHLPTLEKTATLDLLVKILVSHGIYTDTAQHIAQPQPSAPGSRFVGTSQCTF